MPTTSQSRFRPAPPTRYIVVVGPYPGGEMELRLPRFELRTRPHAPGGCVFLSLMVIFLPTVFIWALNGLVLGPGPGLRPQDPTGPVHPPPPFPLPPVSPTTLQLGPKSAPNRHIIEPAFAHNWFNIRLTLSQIGSKLSQIARLSGPIDRRGWQEGVIEGGDKVRANRAPTIPCAPVQ